MANPRLLDTGQAKSSRKTKQYVNTIAALIDKYLQYIITGNEIPLIIAFIVIGWIFVQDNEAGRLEDWRSMLWTIQKCLVFIALYFSYRLIAWIIERIHR